MNSRGIKNIAQLQLDAKCTIDPCQNASTKKRMASEIEEIIV